MARDMMRLPPARGSEAYQSPKMRLGRSVFDLSHNHKTTFDAGYLIPYFVQDVLPGDTFTVKLLAFCRIFSPLDFPVMDNIELSIDFFYVPNRITWANFDDFLGAHDSAGAQDTTYLVPRISDGYTVAEASLYHYMGVPIGLSTTNNFVSVLAPRAYNRIYSDWYRDQNLIDKPFVGVGDGPDGNTNYVLRKSAKKHDYFTSCLPYLQKGEEGSLAAVVANVQTDSDAGAPLGVFSTVAGGGSRRTLAESGTVINVGGTTPAASTQMYVTLEGITINALREAAAIQRLLERDARGGTRLPEIIKMHFGVDVPDYRVQRPEYLGGGRGFINVSPVANTSATATEDQGQLAGVGTGTLSCSWAKSFVEHGYVIGILRARGEVSYHQGLDRHWWRESKYDWMWPEFAHLGEQEVLNQELFSAGDATDFDVFGYQERFAEYRYKKSLITGKLDPAAAGSLDFTHLAEDFASAPALNQTFIEDQTPMARVTTVDTEPDFIIDGRFDVKRAAPLPVRPVPTLAPARF